MRVTKVLVIPLFGAAACSDGGTTAPGGATTLAEITPQPGAAGVDPAGPIMLRFSAPIGTGMERYVDLHRGDIAGPIVPITCTWSTARSTLTCTPGSPLQSRTRYIIHLGSGMMDAGGRRVETEEHGMRMGGQPVDAETIGPMHGGEPAGMMEPGWHGPGDGHFGIGFRFETR